MTREITSERRVSRRSFRARSSWLRFSRLYSVGAGLAVATILVFMSIGVIPCPKIANASHVSGETCKSYTQAHPPDFDYRNNVGIFDAEYRRLCYMENEQIQELQDNLIYAATGIDPKNGTPGEAGGFQITPEQLRQIALRSAEGSNGVSKGLATAGAGRAASAFNGLYRFLSGDGALAPGGMRTPFKGTLDGAGGGASTWKNSSGVIVGQMVITSAEITNGQLKASFSRSGANYNSGEFGIHCKAINNYAYDVFINAATPNPIVKTQNIPAGDCRFFTMDRQDNSPTPAPKYFGPNLSQNSGVITPRTYNLTEVGKPEPLTADPPAGDTVLLPHESRILYDNMTQDPDYKPRTPPEAYPPPPPGVDEDQWKQHQRRIKELTPPHGAPVGDPTVRVNEDGSLTTRFADGTELTTWPDLTELVKLRDGTELWKYPGGVTREKNPTTGEEVITYPDGTQVINNPGQAPVWQRPPAPGEAPVPIPAPNPEAYPPPPSGNYNPPPPAEGGPGGCPKPANVVFVLPPVDFGEKFPFSLIISAKDGLQDLAAPARAPQFELPLVGTIDLGQWAGPVGIMRGFLWFLIGVILMPIFFYTLIKGKE